MTLLRHEWRRLLRTPSFAVLLVVTAGFLAYGTMGGVGWTRKLAASVASAEAEHGKLRAGAGSAYELGRAGMILSLPLRASAPLSVGQSDIHPSIDAVSITTKNKQRADRYELESPLALAGGRFDLAFVLVYVLPLIVLALTSDLLAEERDEGTLGLLLSHPVSLARLIAAKLTARIGPVLVVATVVPLLILAPIEPGLSTSAIGVYCGLVAAYVGFWALLASAVNLWCMSGATTALTVLSLWVVFTLVIPSLASVAVSRLVPMPSPFELIDALRGDDVRNLDGEKLLARYYGDHPEFAPSEGGESGFAERYVLVQRETMRRAEPIARRHGALRRERHAVANQLRLLSPVSILQAALDELAGTDTGRFLDFRERVERLAPAFADWMLPYVAAARPASAVVWAGAPRLAPELASHRELGRALAAIGAYILACFACVLVRLRRLRANLQVALQG